MRKATTSGKAFEILGVFVSDDNEQPVVVDAGLRVVLIVGKDANGVIQAFQKLEHNGKLLGWQQMVGNQVDPDSVPAEFAAVPNQTQHYGSERDASQQSGKDLHAASHEEHRRPDSPSREPYVSLFNFL